MNCGCVGVGVEEWVGGYYVYDDYLKVFERRRGYVVVVGRDDDVEGD